MKKVNANEALALNITEHALNVEFKEVRINGEYSATVGTDRAVPTFTDLLDPFIKLSNGMQTEFDPTVNLMRSSHGAEGTLYNISMPFGTVDLGGRSTEMRISRFGSLNSSCSDKFGLQMLVQICSNGMMGWKSQGTAVTRFTANWQGLSTERIQFALEGFEGMKHHYVTMAESLKSIRLTAPEVDERLNRIVKGESKRSENIREEIRELFISGKGNRGENSWDLFNAVTEYENHYKTYRNTNGVSSDENRAKGVLSIDSDKLAELVA
jgi:hypothetical protein